MKAVKCLLDSKKLVSSCLHTLPFSLWFWTWSIIILIDGELGKLLLELSLALMIFFDFAPTEVAKMNQAHGIVLLVCL